MSRIEREGLPDFIAPMLAKKCEDAPIRDVAYAVELKWDGLRGLVRIDRGRVTAPLTPPHRLHR